MKNVHWRYFGVAAVVVWTICTCTKDPVGNNIPDISGTTWAGMDSKGDYYVYSFDENGILTYTSPSGTYSNGTWTQDNDAVYMETNNKYSERTGTIFRDSMSGDGWNVTGKEWTWGAKWQK